MFRLILLVLGVLFVLLLVAVRYLPWWGILLLLAGIYLLFRYAMAPLIAALFLIPFKAKGAVLKNATAEVHSVTWEPAPEKPAKHEPEPPARTALEYDESVGNAGETPVEEPTEELAEEHEEEEIEEDEQGPQDHFRIDVTITPQAKAGGFQFWEPSELRVVPFSTKSSAKLTEAEGQAGETVDVEIFRDGRFEPDEDGKYPGPLRLRLLMAVPLDAPRRMSFRYYFELFGDLTLPPSGSRL